MKIKILFILALITGLSACEKDLDLVPLDSLTEATFFKTEQDFETFTNQFYTFLPGLNNSDDQSDISMQTGFSSVSNGSYVPGVSDDVWDASYAQCWQTSYLISKVASAPSDLKPSLAKYEAEARFFRAFAHYNLLKRFGGVPIVDKTLGISSGEILYGPRNTRDEVTAFILSELDLAIASLPSVAPADDRGRISKEAALALKARLALFEGTWRKYHEGGVGANDLLNKAIAATDQIFNSNYFQLFDRRDVLGDSSYRFYFLLEGSKQTNNASLTKANQTETILARRHDGLIAPSATLNIGQGVLSPTRKLVDMFLCDDGLPIEKSPKFLGYNKITDEYKNRDPRMGQVLLRPFQKYWLFTQPAYHRNWASPLSGGIKFDIAFGILTQTGYSTHKLQQEIGGPHGNDYPVFRLAEMYLIYAEAVFERNGSISDADLDKSINKVRNRVGMPRLTNAFVSGNGLNMLDEIRRERTIELYVEGFRYDDLRRWKTAEVEMPKPVLGIKWKGT
ncbi:MAG: RagB/SusD family nutrient uptake outer membrane protein, partial [Cyclobacteriaceae bacterium]|nr:RagB/SusD family nutrient uptake outer membrane protein [Cyclobacteriaceae bacterium]